jgi:hypothetical protein
VVSGTFYGIDLKAIVAQILFAVREDLAGLVGAFVRLADVTWDDWGVVEEVEEAAAVLG